MGQTTPGMVIGRPGIAEIDKQPVYLSRGKIISQPGRIAVHKEHIRQFLLCTALHLSLIHI